MSEVGLGVPETDPAGRTRLRVESFTVPPRFRTATFASYLPDTRFPTQAIARERLRDAVAGLHARPSGRRFSRWRGTRPPVWSGLYLDGGFGVGKTHLLAGAYHAFGDPSASAYLSFQELTYVVGALGMAGTAGLFDAVRLLCLDEFELDDPGNTMLATSFVRAALERGTRIIVTSNTLPSELGRGRFNANDFQREIGQLAAAFETVRIDGGDYRHRRFAEGAPLPRLIARRIRPRLPDGWSEVAWRDLLATLAGVHPVHYATRAAALAGLVIRDAAPIPDQDTALRFVHFIDKLYDQCVPLLLAGPSELEQLFPPSYGHGGFERKFRRCRSRLHEMLSEPLDLPDAAHQAADD